MTPFLPFQCPVSYRVELLNLHAHLFAVTLHIAQPAALQTVSLPVWIPGSYLVREFAKHLQNLQAFQPNVDKAHALDVVQKDKCTWEIACQPEQPLVLTYEIYAHDNSVRTAWLDAERGFFNGTSVCLRVEGFEGAAHELQLPAPTAGLTSDWQAATALAAVGVDGNGFGRYRAENYDELVDSPVALGNFWSGSFTSATGIPHRFVVSGAGPNFDGARLLADTQKIVDTQIAFWHPDPAASQPPHRHYLFMLHAEADGYGGLEHRHSTALICNRAALPRLRLPEDKQPEGYTTLCGLISHEYFHTWNVKRLRPAEFIPLQYGAENYTRMLWFFEGFTNYYDDLLLCRAGLLEPAGYLKLLGKTMNQVAQTPGQAVQSLSEASFDAWVKYYRPDANTPNATVNYYSKGSLVALCLDLTLRLESRGKSPVSLDAAMRGLWQRCQGGAMQESDLLAVLHTVGGRSYAAELAAWVHGRAELPLAALLTAHGALVLQTPAKVEQQLGLRVLEKSSSIHIKVVLRGGSAEQAGFATGDEWIGIAPGDNLQPPSHWRISELADIEALLSPQPGQALHALVVRDQRILQLPLLWPAAATVQTLAVQDAALVNAWLGLG